MPEIRRPHRGRKRKREEHARTAPAPLVAGATDRARALALTPVSRETLERLDQFVRLLRAWQRTTNLAWIDLGSGGGFPGLVIACALAGRPGAHVHLIESHGKKAAFLREAQRLTGAPASVYAMRIEEFVTTFKGPLDVITARAVAPLKSLFGQSFPLLGKSGAIALFPKGQHAELELREARESPSVQGWAMDATLVPSRIDPAGRIVVIRNVERRGTTTTTGTPPT